MQGKATQQIHSVLNLPVSSAGTETFGLSHRESQTKTIHPEHGIKKRAKTAAESTPDSGKLSSWLKSGDPLFDILLENFIITRRVFLSSGNVTLRAVGKFQWG